MKLFCIPYAGGSEVYYINWKNKFGSDVDIVPIKLNGRGSRFGKSFFNSIDEAVDDIFLQVVDKISNGEDYAIFGHSMGGILTFELYYKIIENGIRAPRKIFISSSKCPTVEDYKEGKSKLPYDEFLEVLKKYNGTPKEVLESEEILELCIPIIRSDLKLLEEYNYKPKGEKIKSELILLRGKNDTVSFEALNGWKDLAETAELYEFEGGHFYLNDKLEEVIDLIKSKLS